MAEDDGERVLAAMRSGEWLRTQWIARVAFALGSAPWEAAHTARALRVLARLHAAGLIERREVAAERAGTIAGVPLAFTIPRREWRLAVGGASCARRNV
jgi:hypothetical protein